MPLHITAHHSHHADHATVHGFHEFIEGANAFELSSLCEAMPWQALQSLGLHNSPLLEALRDRHIHRLDLIFNHEQAEDSENLKGLVEAFMKSVDEGWHTSGCYLCSSPRKEEHHASEGSHQMPRVVITVPMRDLDSVAIGVFLSQLLDILRTAKTSQLRLNTPIGFPRGIDGPDAWQHVEGHIVSQSDIDPHSHSRMSHEVSHSHDHFEQFPGVLMMHSSHWISAMNFLQRDFSLITGLVLDMRPIDLKDTTDFSKRFQEELKKLEHLHTLCVRDHGLGNLEYKNFKALTHLFITISTDRKLSEDSIPSSLKTLAINALGDKSSSTLSDTDQSGETRQLLVMQADTLVDMSSLIDVHFRNLELVVRHTEGDNRTLFSCFPSMLRHLRCDSVKYSISTGRSHGELQSLSMSCPVSAAERPKPECDNITSFSGPISYTKHLNPATLRVLNLDQLDTARKEYQDETLRAKLLRRLCKFLRKCESLAELSIDENLFRSIRQTKRPQVLLRLKALRVLCLRYNASLSKDAELEVLHMPYLRTLILLNWSSKVSLEDLPQSLQCITLPTEFAERLQIENQAEKRNLRIASTGAIGDAALQSTIESYQLGPIHVTPPCIDSPQSWTSAQFSLVMLQRAILSSTVGHANSNANPRKRAEQDSEAVAKTRKRLQQMEI